MTKETWITAGTAAKILEERFGRPIRVDYVTRLGSLGRLRKQNIGSRMVLYNRHDVEQIQIREKKTTNTHQPQLPITENITIPSTEEKPIPAIPQNEVAQIRVSETNKSITMKRADFVKSYNINNGDFGKWLEKGLGDDRLEVTYYTNEKNRKSACFTPEQIEHNLEVLRRHGKIDGSDSLI